MHNENGEPQTVVLSRADAEALGIQLDPPNSAPMEGVEQMPDETLTEMVHEPQQEEADILPPLVGEPETVPEVPEVIQEPAREEEPETVALDELPKVDKSLAEPETVPEPAGPSTSNDVLSNIIQVFEDFNILEEFWANFKFIFSRFSTRMSQISRMSALSRGWKGNLLLILVAFLRNFQFYFGIFKNRWKWNIFPICWKCECLIIL